VSSSRRPHASTDSLAADSTNTAILSGIAIPTAVSSLI
jgi:hypothetical protein